MSNKVLLGLVAATIFVGAAYLLSRNKTYTPSNIPTTQDSERDVKVVTNEEGDTVRELVVQGNEYSFSPSTISVDKGELVKISFKNVGKYPHNLTIEELGVSSKTINPGETDTFEFSAGSEGKYTFYCGVGDHRARGMEGVLDVDD